MPGHNHYPWCNCGWCVNFGRSVFIPPQTFELGRAQNILRQFGADRSRAACFISHNARCPVCNAQVFYYQNEYGSRVFFDELAPLWTKHPCTDNRRATERTAFAFRGRGAIIEIGQAITLVRGRGELDWRYGLVEATEIRADHTTLRVRFSEEPEPITFDLGGDSLTISQGDVLGMKGELVSFFDRICMEARTVRIESKVDKVGQQPPGELILDREEKWLLNRGTWGDFEECWRLPPTTIGMREEEGVNFHTAGVHVAAFTHSMRGHVDAVWRDGRRSPQAIADAFNIQGLRTACGLEWNPRRVYLLLKLIFCVPRERQSREERAREMFRQRPARITRAGSKTAGLGAAAEPHSDWKGQRSHSAAIGRSDLLKLAKLGRIAVARRKK